MSNFSGIPAEVLYTMAIPVTKNTYTTQAVFSAPTTQAVAKVPASYFSENPNGIGKSLIIDVHGTMATTSAATFQAVLAWDPTAGTLGTTLATPWPTLAPTAALTSLWWLHAEITAQAIGPAGLTLQVDGHWNQSVVASGTLSTANQQVMFQGSSTGLISTAQAFIELWGTWSASAAGNTTTVNQFKLWGVN